MNKERITVCATLPGPLVHGVDRIRRDTTHITTRTGALILVIEAGLQQLRRRRSKAPARGGRR